MLTIQTDITVDQDGKAVLQMPSDFTPDKYQVILVIEEKPVRKCQLIKFSDYPVGLKSENVTFSRKKGE